MFPCGVSELFLVDVVIRQVVLLIFVVVVILSKFVWILVMPFWDVAWIVVVVMISGEVVGILFFVVMISCDAVGDCVVVVVIISRNVVGIFVVVDGMLFWDDVGKIVIVVDPSRKVKILVVLLSLKVVGTFVVVVDLFCKVVEILVGMVSSDDEGMAVRLFSKVSWIVVVVVVVIICSGVVLIRSDVIFCTGI